MDRFHPASATNLTAVVNAVIGSPPATVNLSWINGAFANGVQILRTSAGESNYQVIATLAAGVTSWTDMTTYGMGLIFYRIQSLPLDPHIMFVSPPPAQISVMIGGEPPHVHIGGWPVPVDSSGNANQSPEYLVIDGTH